MNVKMHSINLFSNNGLKSTQDRLDRQAKRDNQIAATKAEYNNSQMFHVLDEAMDELAEIAEEITEEAVEELDEMSEELEKIDQTQAEMEAASKVSTGDLPEKYKRIDYRI